MSIRLTKEQKASILSRLAVMCAPPEDEHIEFHDLVEAGKSVPAILNITVKCIAELNKIDGEKSTLLSNMRKI